MDLATRQASQVILLLLVAIRLPLGVIRQPRVLGAIHRPRGLEVIRRPRGLEVIRQPLVLGVILQPRVQGATQVQATNQPLGPVATHHQVQLDTPQVRLAIRLRGHQEATHLPQELGSTRLLGPWPIHKDSLLEVPAIRHIRFHPLPCRLHRRFVETNSFTNTEL